MIEKLTTRQGKFPGFVDPTLVAAQLRTIAEKIDNGKIFIDEVVTRGYAASSNREEFATNEITITYYEEVNEG